MFLFFLANPDFSLQPLQVSPAAVVGLVSAAAKAADPAVTELASAANVFDLRKVFYPTAYPEILILAGANTTAKH